MKKKESTRCIGGRGEKKAADYLEQRGFVILERNFRCRQGEIDIIGKDGAYTVFAEVKYRSGEAFESPLAAVDLRKMKKICRTADYYRMLHKMTEDAPVRYDVIGICGEEITWIPNAFPHVYAGGTKRRGQYD